MDSLSTAPKEGISSSPLYEEHDEQGVIIPPLNWTIPVVEPTVSWPQPHGESQWQSIRSKWKKAKPSSEPFDGARARALYSSDVAEVTAILTQPRGPWAPFRQRLSLSDAISVLLDVWDDEYEEERMGYYQNARRYI
eukprot:GILI01005127.1.p1 GENE.GILI01005127.1~~GILI01005127.1.p1  ORF type:complete len:137 (+),score=15.68 GILI01005127.1:139-549(+)